MNIDEIICKHKHRPYHIRGVDVLREDAFRNAISFFLIQISNALSYGNTSK